jgi:annexin A6
VAGFYKTMYGQALIDAIKSEMSGDLENILVAIVMGALAGGPAEQWARSLRAAFKGMGTNDKTVCRIVGGCNYEQLKLVQGRYFELYSKPLIEDIAAECSGDYKTAVISKCLNEPTGEEDSMPEPDLTPHEDAIQDFHHLRSTLLRAQQFLVTIDAKRIHKACAGLGTDDGALIAVLSSRTKDSLQKISECYCERYGCTLVGQIKSECSFNYATFLCSMVRDKAKVDALNFRKALKGWGTDDDLLVELTCTRTNKELWEIKRAYQQIFNRDLVTDVKGDTSGVYRKFLVRVLRCRRDEPAAAGAAAVTAAADAAKQEEDEGQCGSDAGKAEEQAAALHEAAEASKSSTAKRVLPGGKDAYLDILTKASPEQAALISAAYEDKYGCSLETMIEENMGFMYRDLRKACKAIIKPRLSVFADLLYQAFKGFGTDDSAVARILGGQDKNMVKLIAGEYQRLHPDGENLVASLQSELSGNFLKAAKAWVENSAVGMDDTPQVAAMHVETIPWDIAGANEKLQVELEKNLDEIARRDAEMIHGACEGFGTDESRLIAILTGRTKPQLARIDTFHEQAHGKTVNQQVLDELSGDLETFMLTLLRDQCEADCHALFKAMDGFGTDELLITSILLNRSRAKVVAIEKRYTELFDKDLTQHVKSEVSGDFEGFLVRILKGMKRSSRKVNWSVAENRAVHLWNAGEATFGTDEDVFVSILSGTSDAQIEAMDACYRNLHSNSGNRSIARSCKAELSGDIQTICVAASLPKIDRFCFLLKKSMDGVGTNESVLIQIIANEPKSTVNQIIDRYDDMYGKSLEAHIDSETSGNFKRAIMNFMFGEQIGEDAPPVDRATPLDDDVMEYFRKRDVLRNCVQYISMLDATKLRKATKGLGTNEAVLTEVVVSQTRDGIRRLDDQFVCRYDMTLVGLVRDECGGDYAKFLVAVIRDPSYSIAELFRGCVKGWGTDETLLSELICTCSNEQLLGAQEAYLAMYDRVLWRDVASDTSGTYRQLLLALLGGSRGRISNFSAEAAAAQLVDSKSWFVPSPSESTFIAVYALFSQAQLAEIAGVFEGVSDGVSLADTIAEQGFSDDFAELAAKLQTPPVDLMCDQIVARFDQPEGTAGAMFKTLSNAMMADWRIIRTIGALPLSTVHEIAARYEEMVGASLASQAEEQLRGDYKDAVLAWLAADPSVGMDDPAVAAMVDQGDKESQPLSTEATEMFLKYDTDGSDGLSYKQIYQLIVDEGFRIPTSLDWFDTDADGNYYCCVLPRGLPPPHTLIRR